MKLLKSFSSFVIPLLVMLVTFSVYLLVTKIVTNYKQSIVNDYSIIVISKTPLKPIKKIASIKVKKIKAISRDKIIGEVKDKLSQSAIDLLNNSLPFFYEVYLDDFPTKIKLDEINKELLSIKNVKKVETFSTDHNKVYSLLMLTKNIVMTLFIVVLISSFFLLMQQIKIWFFEHSERISILQLHGASMFYSTKPILTVMISSTIIALMLVSGLMFIIINNISLVIQPEIISLIPSFGDLTFEFTLVSILAFIIPLLAFSGLLLKHRIKK